MVGVAVAGQACGSVDSCLDRGGRWDYEAERCEFAVTGEEDSGRSVYGDWRVIAYEQPAITALSPEEADAWVGAAAHFADTLASFGTYRCTRAEYSSDSTSARQFLEEYRVDPSALGLGDTIVSTVVTCPGELIWPGFRLYHHGSELVAAWDGTFFILRRR